MNKTIVGLGILVLLAGAVLYLYPATPNQSTLSQTIYPYREYGLILSGVGIVVLVAGLAIPKRKRYAPPSVGRGQDIRTQC